MGELASAIVDAIVVYLAIVLFTWIAAWAFSLPWSWQYATGIWAVMVLVRWTLGGKRGYRDE